MISTTDTPLIAQTPIAPIKPKALVKHGHTRIDNYYWLNERENPEVIQYLEAENQYTEKMMEATKPLQEKLFEEIKGRIKQTDMSVPYLLDGYYYYTRFEEGKEYPIYCRKKGSLQGAEEVLLNVNELAEGKEFCSVSSTSVSPDDKTLAFAVDYVGRRQYGIYFKDLRTGKISPNYIPISSGSITWAMDNKHLFYAKQDDVTLRSNQIFRHKIGTSPKEDHLVYEEKDETFYTYVYRTKSKKYIIIHSSSTLSDEVRILESQNPTATPVIFQPRERNLEYSIDHFEDRFYILTNWQASNFRVMQTDLKSTEKNHWKELIPHRPDVLVESILIFKDFLVIKEKKKGLDALQVIRWKDRQAHYIDFGEATYSANPTANYDYNTATLRFSFTSLVTPNSTFDYDMNKKQKTLLKQQEVLGGYNSQNYQSEYIYATAQDGTKVPISLVYKKGFQKNGQAPLLLYAYGSYGASMSAYFSASRISLLDRGFVFAIAHIRGGSEMGREWYEKGKMFHKKNTFTDFIDCALHLINEKYTNTNKLFAQGGSAGGLLMGAVINMRPDLFKGVIAAVPFVDVVTTMLDDSIPLTTGEYDEWGNPNDINAYIYMLSYSPYDQVERKQYPNLLVTTGLHDSQVQYFEPAKWVAKLRNMKTDNNLLLLKTDMSAGHGGKTGRFQALKDIAFEYAFMLRLVEINE